jgi:hypothetical protein
MDPIPEEVRRFADRHVESIDQLEILRVLAEAPDKEWDAAGLAAAIQADPKAVSGHVAALQSRGLVWAEKRADWVARHGPHTPDLAAQLGRLLDLYRERPVSMIKLIYAQAASPLRAFAQAFQIRKEDG